MAQKFLNRQQAADALGVSIDEINIMRERQQLHGYRDGADWKFKAEDIERVAAELQAATPPPQEPEPQEPKAQEPEAKQPQITEPEVKDTGDVLLSEVALGQSSVSSSGTVIGLSEEPSDDADMASTLAGFEDLDVTLDQDTRLSQNQVEVEAKTEPAPSSGSTVDLTAELEDDDLVLSSSSTGSGSGSDITIGGDSGISLVDPTDSGLSLDEPLDLVGGSKALLLDDSSLNLSEATDTESPTQLLRSDGDFMLTPIVEGTEDEESGSGSQVIALDDAQAMQTVGAGSGPMPPMLDEELGGELGVSVGLQAAPMGAAQEYAAAQPTAQPSLALPEAPYTTWNIVSLGFCAVFLLLAGMMMFDILRNMWSWGTPYRMNSWLMDLVLSLFGK